MGKVFKFKRSQGKVTLASREIVFLIAEFVNTVNNLNFEAPRY